MNLDKAACPTSEPLRNIGEVEIHSATLQRLRRGRSDSGMTAEGTPITAGLSVAGVGDLIIPSAINPGQAEQTPSQGARSFVQWGAPPGALARGPLPLRAGRRQTG